MTKYKERVAQGLCGTCGQPQDDGKAQCSACREKIAARKQEKQQQYRDAGLCPKCGKRPPRDGKQTCESCGAKQARDNARSRDNKKAANLCINCGQPSDGKASCPACREKAKQRNQERYQQSAEAGLCVRCGVVPARDGLRTCQACSDATSDAEAAQQRRDARREEGLCIQCGAPSPSQSRCSRCRAAAATARRQRYQQLVESGLCGSCGQRPPREGHTCCQQCQDQANDTASSRYYKNKEAGVCRQCGADSGGKHLCANCITYARDYSKRYYQRMREEGRCTQCTAKLPPSDNHAFCPQCREKHNERSRDRWANLKQAALEAYGGPICCGCGEDEPAILEIDHINGGGNEHRKLIGQSNMYLWLKNNNYPPGYRVLCPTCNKKAHAGLPLPQET